MSLYASVCVSDLHTIIGQEPSFDVHSIEGEDRFVEKNQLEPLCLNLLKFRVHPVEEVSVVRDIEVYLSLSSLNVLELDAMGLVNATDG